MSGSLPSQQPSLAATTIPDLPEDVFLLILQYLEAWDVIRCQKVCHAWRNVFTKHVYLREALKRYPRARELRQSSKDGVSDTKLRSVLDDIASRYFHLAQGKARSYARYQLKPVDQIGVWYPVGPWEYHESQPAGRLYYDNAVGHLGRSGNKPYLFLSTLWSYDDGLVAACFEHDATTTVKYSKVRILDIESGTFSTVPLDLGDKIIRSIYFRNRTLVIDWAELRAYHNLNLSDEVHRHFSTCFDVLRSATGDCEITFRNEFKPHFLGLPLTLRDRLLAVHNGHHYAVYFWQPNRSMYTGDEDMPIEALFVWDISIASPYRPSADPASKNIPPTEARPHMISRLSFRELDFLGIRQHSNVALMGMKLDSDSMTLQVRENFAQAGQGYFDPAERLMCARLTTIPFVGLGPAHVTEHEVELPPYRGHCSMESTFLDPSYLDEKWFLPVMDVYDKEADVRFSLIETNFTGNVENKLGMRCCSLGQWRTMNDETVRNVGVLGRVAGDERWIMGVNAYLEFCVARF